jgi:hypothetical protein
VYKHTLLIPSQKYINEQTAAQAAIDAEKDIQNAGKDDLLAAKAKLEVADPNVKDIAAALVKIFEKIGVSGVKWTSGEKI